MNPRGKYRLLLWDFDGTLAASLSEGLRIFNELAHRYRFLPIDDPGRVREMGIRRFLRTHRIPLRKVPWLLRQFQKAQAASIAQVPLVQHVAAVLEPLQRHAIRSGIVSTNSESNIRTCLRANHVEAMFEFIHGHSRLFGKRRALLRTLKSQSETPDQALYVGDEVRDVEAAKAAGIDSAAVTWGFNSRNALAASEPTYLLDSADELLQIVGI